LEKEKKFDGTMAYAQNKRQQVWLMSADDGITSIIIMSNQ
jgi:IS1 family transposase